MSIKPIPSQPDRRPKALALLLIGALMLMACAGVGDVSSAVGAASTAAAALGSQTAPLATAPGSSGAPQSTARCQTIGTAYLDFEGQYPLLAMSSDDAYAANTPDSPTYINTVKLDADLDVLGTLPNGSLGAISPAIAQIRQLVDQVASNIQSGNKPFSDGSGDGQKVIDEYLKLAQPYTVVSEAFASACPDYAAATAAPAQAGFQIGQTANVGDLRVTLDKVSEPALNQNNLPQPGNRFLLAHVTVENTGKDALQVTGLTETHLQDAAGNIYGFDPFANNFDAVSGVEALDALIPAGGSHSGLVGYQVPATAGDLLWTFQDYGQNNAIFAVKDSDIDVSEASSAPTAAALQNSAGATMTAFFGLVATADAADMTETPAP